jgi:protein-S-isoprenylcysteine O-methyltransferase Ste14
MAPPSAVPANQSPWHPTEGLRTALTWLFVVVALTNLVSALAHFHRSGVIGRLRDGTATLREARRADDLVGAASIAVLSLILMAGIVFIVWQWRTAKNAASLGRTDPRYEPGWSIGGWFIPFGNLVIPVLIMQDLWRSADPESPRDDWRSGPRSALIGWWWGAFIVAGLISRTSVFGRSSLSGLQAADTRASFGAVVAAIAAILAIAVVRSLTARQTALRASLMQ